MAEEYSYIIKTYIVNELYELIEDKTSYISHLPKEILRIIIKYCGNNVQQLKQINSIKKLISFVKDISIYTDYFYMEILSTKKINCIVELNDVNYFAESVRFKLLNPHNYDIAEPYIKRLKISQNVKYINFINEKNKFIVGFKCNNISELTIKNEVQDIYIKPMCFPVLRYNDNEILDIIKRINIKND